MLKYNELQNYSDNKVNKELINNFINYSMNAKLTMI